MRDGYSASFRNDVKSSDPRHGLVLTHAVFSGSERFDYGPKRPSVLCGSESQAQHMAKFWGGYYEVLRDPIVIEMDVAFDGTCSIPGAERRRFK